MSDAEAGELEVRASHLRADDAHGYGGDDGDDDGAGQPPKPAAHEGDCGVRQRPLCISGAVGSAATVLAASGLGRGLCVKLGHDRSAPFLGGNESGQS